MKRLFSFAVMALAAFLSVSCGRYSYESVPGDPTGARIYTLDNGLRVYMIVNRDEPRIETRIAVKVGSKNDPRETTGLAHYFEHLMFKGTENFGTMDYEREKPLLDSIEALFEIYRITSGAEERAAIYRRIDSISFEASKIMIPNEYDKLMAAIGSRGSNAYTSNDVTCYVENIPSNQIENWAAIQADRFENCVLRGFHTELETIYEEYNMYSTQDQSNAIEALMNAMFEAHPYNTPVIGWPEHLKNPSITNVRKYHDKWYVPDNMAICLVGDFDPDRTIEVIDRHFGKMKPGEEPRDIEFEPEKPITSPIVRDVPGLESPMLYMGWRFGGAGSEDALYLELLEKVLSNGVAGLIDLDVNQQQKCLGMYSGVYDMADYSAFLVLAQPKAGQSLDQLRDIALEEIAKVGRGEFDEALLEAIVNNMKREYAMRFESPEAMVSAQVNSFIDDIPWEKFISKAERLSAITREDLMAFVNANFTDSNYVRINKLEVRSLPDTRIAKPAITPIFTNRDTSSRFLEEVKAARVKPIDPVFVDFRKDMSILAAKSDIPVYYKKNETNGLFDIVYLIESGTMADNRIDLACKYLDFIGTSTMSAAEIKKAFYSLACDFTVSCTGRNTYISVSGLAENMDKALALAESLIADAQPSPEALRMLKANILEERRSDKLDQRKNFLKLRSYVLYGPEGPSSNVLSNEELISVTDGELLAKISGLFNREHKIFYYGPLAAKKFISKFNSIHRCAETLEPVVEGDPYNYDLTASDRVVIAPYDANQVMLSSISNIGQTYNPEEDPIVTLYNEYFGGGMSSIVFQEMREARGLAYTAYADYVLAQDLDHNNYFVNYIATQNDKLIDALAAFDEITENMPVSELAFDNAKEAILSNLRTSRTIKSDVLWAYYNASKLGLDHDIAADRFEKISGFTLDDVVKFQQESVKGRPYSICILGREKDLDMKALSKYGEIKRVTTEEIFGY